MLDYYGSILKDEEDIKREIVSYFRGYDEYQSQLPVHPYPLQPYYEDHIVLECYETLRKEDLIFPEYSVSGWGVFGYHNTIHYLKQRVPEAQEISNRLRRAKQRLAFMVSQETYTDAPCLDLLESICQSL